MSSSSAYCSIKSSQLLQKSVLNRWHILKKINGINGEKKTILRKFLIVRIYLKDNSSAYLLEIQEKNNEGFSRLFFNTPDKMLSPTIILDLLCTIVSNKGNYSKTQRDQRKTSKDHSKENRGITPDSLGILIKKLKIHMKVKKSELGGILWEQVH